MITRNINDDSTLSYLFNKTRNGASDALQKAVDTINATIASIQSALNGKVSKSGDTMTGTLTMEGSGSGNTGDVWIKNTSYARGGTPGSASIRRLTFVDKNNATVALVAGDILTDGNSRIRIGASSAGGSNNVNLLIAADGTKSVAVDDPAGWRKAIGLNYAANDTFSITASVSLIGSVHNQALTDAYLDFVTDRSMEDISTVTVTTLNGTLRGVSGNIDSSSAINFVSSSAYTVSATKQSDRHVRIRINKSSAFSNATAYTPVVYWGSIGLKFT